MRFRPIISICIFTLLAALMPAVAAEPPVLAGHTYSNSDIMKGELERVIKEGKRQMAVKKEEAEKKRGRKLTDDELKEIGEDIQKNYMAGKVMSICTRVAISVHFISDRELEMKTDISLNEGLLKEAKVGWFKRKTLRLALSALPSTMKGSYIRRDNLVIISPDDVPDTLRVTDGALRLTGTFDGTPFVLDRKP